MSSEKITANYFDIYRELDIKLVSETLPNLLSRLEDEKNARDQQ
jgi:hypothetical protein